METQTSFEAWTQEWLRRKEPFIKYSTFAAYTNIAINHLIPYWGEAKLTEISEDRVQEYVLHLVTRCVWMGRAASTSEAQGTSWWSSRASCAMRRWLDEDRGGPDIGFRVALVPVEK